ncbi:MAG: hypothetical protein AAGF87_03435 [Bacteroidota bacterium]
MHLIYRTIFLLSILSFFIACGTSGGASESAVQEVSPEPQTSLEASTELPELIDPCSVAVDDLIAAFGWSDGTGPFPNASNKVDFRACDYVGSGADGRLTIQARRMGQEATFNKYLELNFRAALGSNSGSMSWRSVDGWGDQAIYGHGQNGPNRVYRLEYRLGNHTKISLSYTATEERDPEAMLVALEAVAGSF